MRNYLFCSIVLIGLFFIGCKSEVDVSVMNSSGIVIDSILVSISGKNQMFKTQVPVDEEREFAIDFSNPPKGDGALMFSFYLRNGSKKEYSEYLGAPRGHYYFEILADTIKLKPRRFF